MNQDLCPTCKNVLIYKGKGKLFLAGIAFVVLAILLIWVNSVFWIPAIVLFLTALYLICWSILGRGMWCRHCKKFPGLG